MSLNGKAIATVKAEAYPQRLVLGDKNNKVGFLVRDITSGDPGRRVSSKDEKIKWLARNNDEVRFF